jgi:hypothetical protein
MLTDMLVDFLVLVSIVILCIIGIVNTDKLDSLVSSSTVSGVGGQKKIRYLGVVSKKWWVAALYGVTHFLILFGGFLSLIYFIMISWAIPIFWDWVIQKAGFHDGHYVPFWPYLLLMIPFFFLSVSGIGMLLYGLVWGVKRLLLRAGFLEWKVSSVEALVRTGLPDPEKTGEQLGSWVLSYLGVKHK